MTDLSSDHEDFNEQLPSNPEDFDLDAEQPESAGEARASPERLESTDDSGGLNWHFVVGLLIAASGIAYLVTDGLSSETYFFTVDEAVAKAESVTGERVRVKGTVVEGSIEGDEGSIGRDFTLSAKGETLRIRYDQAMPDTFKEEAQVVATGTLADPGTLEADKVLVKCPSRYEGSPPTSRSKQKQSTPPKQQQ